MRRLVGMELRRLARWWMAWLLVAAVIAVGVAMLPLNADVYLTYVYNDPQGAEQELEAYRVDLAAAATSGLGWAQLVALLLGAALALLDDPGAVHPSRVVAKAAAVAVAGLALAALDVAVILPQVPAALAGTIGAPAHVDVNDARVWTVVVCGALQVALFGVIGVGLATTFGRWWPLLTAAGIVAAGAAAFLGKDLGAHYALAGLAGLPMLLLWYLMVTGAAPVATVLSALAAACALATGLIRASRLRERRA